MQRDHSSHIRPQESAREYLKFGLVISTIIVASTALTLWSGWGLSQFMSYFMGLFFITFAVFKLVNLQTFAITYKGYDIITKKFPVWGYIFPFVELGLGFAYLLIPETVGLHVVTVLVTGVASIGVIKELRSRSDIMCACLGTVIRLPLSKISFVEDLLMFVMATVMLSLI